MHVSLTPVLANYVNELVDSGLYNNASEVFRDALRIKKKQEMTEELKLEKLRAMLKTSEEQFKNGEYTEQSVVEIFDEYVKLERKKTPNNG